MIYTLLGGICGFVFFCVGDMFLMCMGDLFGARRPPRSRFDFTFLFALLICVSAGAGMGFMYGAPKLIEGTHPYNKIF